MGILGFFKKIGKGIGGVASKIGKGIGSVAGKIGKGLGEVIKHPEMIGKAIASIPSLAQKALEKVPVLEGIPVVGQALKLASKAGTIKDIGEAVAKGDFGKAGKQAVGMALSATPIGTAQKFVRTAEMVGRGARAVQEAGRR